MKRNTTVAVFVLLNLVALASQAGRPRERCNDDFIDRRDELIGRNAWMRKCGYISREDENYQNGADRYWVFSNGTAPTNLGAPCEYGRDLFVPCPLGCFAETESILFSGVPMILSDPRTSLQATVTTLAATSTASSLTLTETPIDFLTAGPEVGSMICFADEDGNGLEVTTNHPLIAADGRVFAASGLKSGDMLLSLEGARRVVSVSSCPARGQVWNVQPISDEALANTCVSNGFITGTLRFQNEWDSDAHRLRFRDALVRQVQR